MTWASEPFFVASLLVHLELLQTRIRTSNLSSWYRCITNECTSKIESNQRSAFSSRPFSATCRHQTLTHQRCYAHQQPNQPTGSKDNCQKQSSLLADTLIRIQNMNDQQGKNANPGQTPENANSGHKGRFFYIAKYDKMTDYFEKLINRIERTGENT